MCGIAAVFAYGAAAAPVDRDEVRAMRERMFSRGPDGDGEYFSDDGRVGFGHRRLSIIDISPAGAQPMWNANRSVAIIYNGEIYNYRELRSQLLASGSSEPTLRPGSSTSWKRARRANGYQFQSNCDTEVLLALYATRGERMLEEVRGMYAFAIWDKQRQGLFLARDPFGIKPLYYSDNGHTFRVASQVKPLRDSGKIDLAPEPAGHVGYFLWGHVPDPYTTFRNIRSLPAGSTMWIDRNGAKPPRVFCNISSILAESEAAAAEVRGQQSEVSGQISDISSESEVRGQRSAVSGQEQLRAALAETVRYHLVADVPVGIFLSSGLDSTTIAALAAEQGGILRTVTLGFEEYRGTDADETPLAEQFAKRCGAQHQTIWVSRGDFEGERDHLFEAMDRPTIDGVNTFFVSLAAKQANLKVALSGLGGDELFASYPSFRDIPRMVNLLKPFAGLLSNFGRDLRIVSAPLVKRLTSPKYAGIFEYGGSYSGAYLLRRGLFMPWELPDLLDPDMVRAGWQELQTLLRLDETLDGIQNQRLKISALEMSWYMRHQLLRDSDWAGMGHSVEIRVPFVDVDLLRGIAPLLASKHAPSKRDMAAAASPLVTSEILNRRKTGFQIPVRDWLMHEISTYGRFQPRHQVRSRGLRGWAREVYSHFVQSSGRLSGLRVPGYRRASAFRSLGKTSDAKLGILMLLTDGFGGFGGIAQFNRDFMRAVSSSPDVEKILAVPRLMHEEPGVLPPKLTHVIDGLGGKQHYIWAVLRTARDFRASKSLGLRPVIICAHIHLVPAALAVRRITGAEVYLIVYGVDAWQPTRDRIANACVGQVDDFISISAVTRRRFLQWSGLRQDQGIVLPLCVNLSAFRPGSKSVDLMRRYELNDQRVLLTLGRLESEERYKGFDEIIECLPEIGKAVPDVTYLIAGDGPDRPRLVCKARELGLRVHDHSNLEYEDGASPSGPVENSLQYGAQTPRVIFVGRIKDDVKADYYRLADLFVMPSSGEGFGIVLLEAMACGVPVIASKVDGSREALRDGELGKLVDPRNPVEIREAVIGSLKSQTADRTRPVPGVEYFSTERFEERVHAIIGAMRGHETDSLAHDGWQPAPVGYPQEQMLAENLVNNGGDGTEEPRDY
jgi:asparagine synthase (glutamine-hydrolysing)